MKQSIIKKRCERCEKVFIIENIKQSPARELVIQFTPCPYCLYIKEEVLKSKNVSGRCVSCSIPFAIVDHHGLGMCKRCHMNALRLKALGVIRVKEFLDNLI